MTTSSFDHCRTDAATARVRSSSRVTSQAVTSGAGLPLAAIRPASAARSSVRRAARVRFAPAHVLQRKHGLYAENRPVIRLDPAVVPGHLRDLIPLAEKWGIEDDIIRFDFEEKSSASERDELVRTVAPRLADIDAWLQTA